MAPQSFTCEVRAQVSWTGAGLKPAPPSYIFNPRSLTVPLAGPPLFPFGSKITVSVFVWPPHRGRKCLALGKKKKNHRGWLSPQTWKQVPEKLCDSPQETEQIEVVEAWKTSLCSSLNSVESCDETGSPKLRTICFFFFFTAETSPESGRIPARIPNRSGIGTQKRRSLSMASTKPMEIPHF
jgi:hypothetical protein